MNLREELQERYGKGHLSYSSIKHALGDMRKWEMYMRGELRKESTALNFGSLYDCMLLTPDDFDSKYMILNEEDILNACSKETRNRKTPSATKEYRQVYAMLDDQTDKQIVKASDHEEAMRMIERLGNEGLIDQYLTGGKAQVEFNVDVHDVPLRGFLDYLHDDYILDSKTVGRESSKFKWDVQGWSYDIQAYIYMQVFPREEFLWLIQEKTAPYYPGVVTCTQQTLFNGEMKFEEALDNIKCWLSTDPSEQTGHGRFSV